MVINGVKSDPKSINASVPQGSILGPLLFLVYVWYVTDIVEDLDTLPYLFADDTSLFSTIDPKNTVETFNKINNDLEKLARWSEQWRVTFNAAKTVYMIISRAVVDTLSSTVSRQSRICDCRHAIPTVST